MFNFVVLLKENGTFPPEANSKKGVSISGNPAYEG